MCNKVRRPPPGCPICCPPACCEPRTCYCIFDLESAVFDTRNVYRRAVLELAASYNCVVPELVLLKVGVMATSEMAELIVRKCNIPVSWEQFLLEINERASALISNPPLMDGAERLVRHLHKCCIRMALISSSCEDLYCKKIRGYEKFFELFETLICADDPQLKQPKPEPDVYLIAMCRLGEADTDNTLVFDGTIKGVQAASDARLKVVMVPEKELPYCWSERAALRLETLEQFKPEWFGIAPLSKEAFKPKPKPKPMAVRPEMAKQESREEKPGDDAEDTDKKEEKVNEDDAANEEPVPVDDADEAGLKNWDKIRQSVRKSLRQSRKSDMKFDNLEDNSPFKKK